MSSPTDDANKTAKQKRTYVKVDKSVAKMSADERSDFAHALYQAIMAEWGRNPDGSENQESRS